MIPGQILPGRERVEINAGLEVTKLSITNRGDVPVHLTAHFHVFEANPRLAFDRRRAWGMRLDVPASGSVRFEPGETRDVTLVPIGGERVIRGFQGVVDGALDQMSVDDALARLIDDGFLNEPG